MSVESHLTSGVGGTLSCRGVWCTAFELKGFRATGGMAGHLTDIHCAHTFHFSHCNPAQIGGNE